MYCGLPEVVRSAKADNIQSRQEHLRIGVRQYLLEWGTCADCVVQVADDRSTDYKDVSDVQNTRFIVSILLWRHTFSTTLKARFHDFTGTTGILNSVYTYLQGNAASISSTSEFYRPVAYVPIRCVIRLGFDRQLTAGLSRVVVIQQALTMRIQHEIPACAAHPELCAIRVVPLGSSSDSWTVSNSYARRYEPAPEGGLTMATRFSVQVWSTTDTTLHNRLYALFEKLKTDTGTALRDFRRQILEEVNGPVEIKFDEYDSPFFGKQGIYGWLEHGTYGGAASSLRTTTKQYVCLRRTGTAFVFDSDSESYQYDPTLVASPLPPAATLFVFDSRQDYVNFFAFGQNDSSLVRHSVDARDISGVRELIDPGTGSRFIELEIVSQYGSDGGVGLSRVVILQASSTAQRAQWLKALRGFVPVYSYRILSCGIMPHSVNGLGVLDIMNQRRDEIFAGISIRSSTVSYRYDARFLKSRALRIVFNIPSHDNYTKHGEPALPPINTTHLKSSVRAFFGENVIAAGHDIQLIRVAGGMLTFEGKIFTFEHAISCTGLGFALSEEYGIGVLDANKTCATDTVLESNFTSHRESIRTHVQSHLRNTICAADHVMNGSCGLWNDNAVGVTYSAVSHHISIFVRSVHSWTASRLLRELPMVGTTVLSSTTGLKRLALHEGTDVLIILAWKLEYFAGSYLDFSNSNMQSWTVQPIQRHVYNLFWRLEDGTAGWLGLLTSMGGYSFATSVDLDVSSLAPQDKVWIRRVAPCKWHGRRLFKPGDANTVASLNVGCRHRTRVTLHFELSNLHFSTFASHADIRTIIRNSAYDRLCDQYQCAVRVDIALRSSIGSLAVGSSINGERRPRSAADSGDYVVRLTVWSPTLFVADYMRNHLHLLTSCHEWLRHGIGFGAQARCVDFGMGAGEKHVSTLDVLNLLPTASITELLWDTYEDPGEFKQTDSLRSDFRFSCASSRGDFEEDLDENGNANDAKNRSNAASTSAKRYSSEVCMFSYRIIKLSGGNQVLGGGANSSSVLSDDDLDEDCLMMAAKATDNNNATANVSAACGVARNATRNATAPIALTTGQRWLSIHDGRLEVYSGTAEEITIFDACLLGVVKPSLKCTPALGPGRYRLEVLASYADDPEYEQDTSVPTTFEWLIRKDMSEEVTSVLVDTAADSLDNMDRDMSCEEMNKVVSSMGTFMNRTSCALDIDPAAVYEKRQNEMNLVINALNAYAPRILGFRARYDQLLNSYGRFNDPDLFFFNDDERPLTQRTAQNKVVLTAKLKFGEISMQNYDAMFVEYRIAPPIGPIRPIRNSDNGKDSDNYNDNSTGIDAGTNATAEIVSALSGCDWYRCNVSDPGSPCTETWTRDEGTDSTNGLTLEGCKLNDGSHRMECSMTFMQVEIDVRVDGLYSAQMRLIRDNGRNTSIPIPTPNHLLQTISWESDHESPRLTLDLCENGDCYTSEDSPIEFGTAVFHEDSPRGVVKGNTNDMIYYAVVDNAMDRDVVDYQFAGDSENNAIGHGEAKICLDHGALYRDPTSAAKDAIWKRRKSPAPCFNATGAFRTVNATVCNGDFIETGDADASVGFRCDQWGVNGDGKRMFRITVPVDVNAFEARASVPKRTLERRLEVSLADEAGNGNTTSVSWFQTMAAGDPRPKKPGNLTYEFVDQCTMSVRWVAAANLHYDENNSVINARGIPPTSGHMIWWTQSDRSNARKIKTIVEQLTEANILRHRRIEDNMFGGPEYENSSRWAEYFNYTYGYVAATTTTAASGGDGGSGGAGLDPELFGPNANTNGNLQRGVHAALYTEPQSQISTDIWSMPLSYSGTTSFTLRTRVPVWNKATWFSITALAPRANDGSLPLEPYVLGPENARAWTIVEDCIDSNDYLDASGPMYCPPIPGKSGRVRMRDRECEKREWQCRECMPGADCSGLVVWPAVGVLNAHWRSYWDHATFLPCDEPEACLGALGAQQRSCDAPNNTIVYGKCNHALGYAELCAKPLLAASVTDLASVPLLKQCNLCTRCRWGNTPGAGGTSTPRDSRFTRSFGSISKCEKCWTKEMHALLGVLVSLVFCLITGWYVRNNQKTGYRSNNKLLHKALQIKGKMDGVEAVATDERAKYKLALMAQMNKCIITVTFAGSLSLNWHPAARSMFSIYKVITLFVGDLLHLDCLDLFVYEEDFPFVFKEALFWVVGFVALILIFVTISLLFSRSKKGRRINTVATLLATIETLYPTICQKVFGLVACRWVGDRRFMLYDLDVECYVDARHRHFVAAIAAPATILFIVLIPLAQCIYTWDQRHNSHHQNIAGRVFYRLMTVGLRPAHYLWRTMEKLETALIVFVLVFTLQYGPFLHTFAYVSIVTFTAGFEVYCDPYRTIRIQTELSEEAQLRRKSGRAAFGKSDQTHENVFQDMKSRAVSLSLFNVFLGALSLGEDRHKQWRSKWWVSWETLQIMVAVMMILGNIAYICWVVHLVYSQFGWYQRLRDWLCRCTKQKAGDRALLKVTPELRKRQEHVGRGIVRRLSDLAKYRNESHRTLEVPPTAIVPDEEKVIEAVISAGERFETAARKKSKLFAMLKVKTQQARERLDTQKKKQREKGKLQKVDSIANDGLFSATGHRKQSKKGRKLRPPGRGVAKTDIDALRRRRAERLAKQTQKDGGQEAAAAGAKKNPELVVVRGSRMPGPNTGGGGGGGRSGSAVDTPPVSELRSWKVKGKSSKKAAEGKAGGGGDASSSPASSALAVPPAGMTKTKTGKKTSPVMARAEGAKAKAEALIGKAEAAKAKGKGGAEANTVDKKAAKNIKGQGEQFSLIKGGVDAKGAEKGKAGAAKAKAKVEKGKGAKASGAAKKKTTEKAKPTAAAAAVLAAGDSKLVGKTKNVAAAKGKEKVKAGGAEKAAKLKDDEEAEKAKAKKAKEAVMSAKAEKKKREEAKAVKKAKYAGTSTTETKM